MDVLKITPRGYCYGVVDAIQLAKQITRRNDVPRPIYILGLIVHNRHVVTELKEYGIISLDGAGRLSLLDDIDSGTVVFTAHGVSPEVKQKARDKGLYCVDATCPDVTKTHDLVKEFVSKGYDIIYVGKKGHPEPEGVLGEAPDQVFLVENDQDVENLNLTNSRLVVTTQTTLSQWDTKSLIDQIVAKYPHVEVYNEICLATQQRQEAAAIQARAADVVLVVGDERSNNSNRLVQVVQELADRPAYLVDNVQSIDPRWLAGATTVGITSGSSTPTHITREVVEWVEAYDPNTSKQQHPHT